MKTYKLYQTKLYHFGLWFDDVRTDNKVSHTRYFKSYRDAKNFLEYINYGKFLIPRLFDYKNMCYCTSKLF